MAGCESIAQPKYEDMYRIMHGYKLAEIKTWVQVPPPGVFNHMDLRWAVTKRPHATNRLLTVDVAHIPWSRVDDFILGEETRADSRCDFVRRGIEVNKERSLEAPKWNSFLESIRYHCQYGPQDFSGRRQEIVPELPRKKYDKHGKYIPNGKGHKGPRNTPAKNGGSVK